MVRLAFRLERVPELVRGPGPQGPRRGAEAGGLLPARLALPAQRQNEVDPEVVRMVPEGFSQHGVGA
jgi:hypothetical protein